MPKGKLELYSERQFFVVTGNHVIGTPTTINERQDQLLSILSKFFLEPKAEKQRKFYEKSPKLPNNYQPAEIPQDDNELWQIMFREKNGSKWESLFHGDTGDYVGDDGHVDESAAEYAQISKLVYYTGHDATRVERMMWQTALVRDKWTSHPTYLKLTIGNAMTTVTKDYDPMYYQHKAKRIERELFEEIRMNHQAKFAEQSEQAKKGSQEKNTFDTDYEDIPFEDDEARKEEPKVSIFDQVKELLMDAIEKQDVDAVYALADMVVMLTAQEQASIKSIIERNKKQLLGFSLSSYKDCLKEAKDTLKRKKAEEREKNNPHYDVAPYYKSEGSGMWMTIEPTEKNPEPDDVKISNFTAEIVTDITLDDGAEKTRLYELDADLSGQLFNFELPVEDFPKCDWIDIHIGARARLEVFSRVKDHLIAAIKYVSSAQRKLHYAHTGWCKINGTWVYLHNAGHLSGVSGVGSEEINYTTHTFFTSQSAYSPTSYPHLSGVSGVSGVDIEASVKLTGSLANYAFPDNRDNMQQAIRASLGFMDLTKDTITMPLYASVWRSVLGEVDFGIHLAGQTGLGKSEVCALLQQFFGAVMNARKLPGSWSLLRILLRCYCFRQKIPW